MTIEDLYNFCLERVTVGDIEAGEEVLISCITYLSRAKSGRCDRDRVSEDVAWFRGMDKYRDELSVIATLDEDELSILISDNFNATPVVTEAKRIYDMVKTSNVQNKTEAQKVLKGVRIFLMIAKHIGGLDYKLVKSEYKALRRKKSRNKASKAKQSKTKLNQGSLF